VSPAAPLATSTSTVLVSTGTRGPATRGQTGQLAAGVSVLFAIDSSYTAGRLSRCREGPRSAGPARKGIGPWRAPLDHCPTVACTQPIQASGPAAVGVRPYRARGARGFIRPSGSVPERPPPLVTPHDGRPPGTRFSERTPCRSRSVSDGCPRSDGRSMRILAEQEPARACPVPPANSQQEVRAAVRPGRRGPRSAGTTNTMVALDPC